jgi:hypothetical protein
MRDAGCDDSVDHWQMQLVRVCGRDRLGVSSVGVAGDTSTGIIGEDALQAHAHLGRAVGNDDLASVE